MGIRVTVEDTETGETATREIENDYVLVTDGTCWLDGVQQYSNGTTVLTVKGRK